MDDIYKAAVSRIFLNLGRNIISLGLSTDLACLGLCLLGIVLIFSVMLQTCSDGYLLFIMYVKCNNVKSNTLIFFHVAHRYVIYCKFLFQVMACINELEDCVSEVLLGVFVKV